MQRIYRNVHGKHYEANVYATGRAAETHSDEIVTLHMNMESRCFSPGAPPRRQLLEWPCGLPVSCPGVSRLASRGLSLHDLVL
jgi:hypothetical protein